MKGQSADFQMNHCESLTLFEVIGCSYCLSDEDDNLFIGKSANASDVEGLINCPSCRTHLRADDLIAVGLDMQKPCPAEVCNAA